jgi:hypothetical protein
MLPLTGTQLQKQGKRKGNVNEDTPGSHSLHSRKADCQSVRTEGMTGVMKRGTKWLPGRAGVGNCGPECVKTATRLFDNEIRIAVSCCTRGTQYQHVASPLPPANLYTTGHWKWLKFIRQIYKDWKQGKERCWATEPTETDYSQTRSYVVHILRSSSFVISMPRTLRRCMQLTNHYSQSIQTNTFPCFLILLLSYDMFRSYKATIIR